jgi:hypothetical protein
MEPFAVGCRPLGLVAPSSSGVGGTQRTGIREKVRTQLRPNYNEQVIATSQQGPSDADLYIDCNAESSMAGARVRLYAVTDDVRSLEAQAIVPLAATAAGFGGIRVASARGRGCDRWEATLSLNAAVPAPTKQITAVLYVYDGPGGPETGGGSSVASGYTWSSTGNPLVALALVSAAARTVYLVTGANAGANARWLHVFDSAAAPVNGDVPIDRYYVSPNGTFSIGYGDGGRPLSSGLAWGVSSTPATFTAAAELFSVTAAWG